MVSLSRGASVPNRNGGTESLMTSMSTAGSPRTSAEPSVSRPCVTSAMTRFAPALRAARAARRSVPPVLIRSSTTRAVAPATLPTNRSPETTPPLRCLSTKALPTGWPRAASSASRNSSARLAPPEIVAGQRSRVIDEQRRSGQRYGAAAKRILERTRTSSVTMQSVPMVPNRLAT
jgi:hypothetical protein